MNRLVLIGNGFDIAHKLPTRYQDFIDWYWNERIKNMKKTFSSESEDNLCVLINSVSSSWYNWFQQDAAFLYEYDGVKLFLN